MKIQTSGMPSIEQLTDQYLNQSKYTTPVKGQEAASFQEILSRKQLAASPKAPLHFSKHAAARLSDRQIELTDDQLGRLQTGTQKAGAKGINESLVLVDDLAFIVNIKNNTVVTALDSTKADESVYTNIDGAVIA